MRLIQSAVASLLAAAVFLGAGCGPTPLQRPEQPRTSPAPAPISPPRAGQAVPSYPSPRAGAAYDDPSTGIAFVASAVPGAEGPVNAVVLGNVALVGVPSNNAGVHTKVAEQIRSSFPHIADVRITSDPAVMGRIAEASELLRTRQSIAGLLPDLTARTSATPTVQ